MSEPNGPEQQPPAYPAQPTPVYQPTHTPAQGGQPYGATEQTAQQPYAPPQENHPYGTEGAQPYGEQPQGAYPAQAYPAQPYGQQPYGQQPHAQQAYGQAPDPTSRTSGMAVAALVVGIISVLLSFIPFVSAVSVVGGIVAVVLGLMAMRKASRGEAGGRGMGLAGLIIGAVAIVVAVVVNVLALSAINSFNESFTETFEGTDGGFLEETEGSFGDTDEAGGTDEATGTDGAAAGEQPTETTDEGTGLMAGALGTRENPATPLEDVVTFSEDETPLWDVTVGAADVDAWDVVQAENEFNEPPAEGNVHVLLPVTATYLGAETGTAGWDLTVNFVAADGRSFETEFQTIPDDLMRVAELYAGGTAEGNLLYEVPADAIEGATWSVEAGWFGEPIFFAVVPQ